MTSRPVDLATTAIRIACAAARQAISERLDLGRKRPTKRDPAVGVKTDLPDGLLLKSQSATPAAACAHGGTPCFGAPLAG